MEEDAQHVRIRSDRWRRFGAAMREHHAYLRAELDAVRLVGFDVEEALRASREERDDQLLAAMRGQ